MFFPDNMNVFARPNWESGYIETACKEIANFALQNQWISVDEALPEYQQDVVVSDGLEYWMSWRTQETDALHKDKNDFINHSALEIKYWMGVPQIKGSEK